MEGIQPQRARGSYNAEEVEFLSMVMEKDSVHMDDSKVKAILEWPEPKNVKGVRSFLGLANFYHQFISSYAQVTQLLNNLMKKDTPFVWGSTQQQAFNMLKEKFTMAPILAYPNNNCKFHLECDSSDFTMGAVLSILKNNKWHPVLRIMVSISDILFLTMILDPVQSLDLLHYSYYSCSHT